MRKITEVRAALSEIPDVFYETAPEDAGRGDDEGIRTLWHGAEVDADREHLSNTLIADEPAQGDEIPEADSDNPALEELVEYGAEIDTNELDAVMGGAAGDEIARSVAIRGVDALAWYAPFHLKGSQWGIYIPVSSLGFLMSRVFGALDVSEHDALRLSLRAVHQHELFHFAVDYASAQVELLARQPCHKPARSLRDNAHGFNLLEEQLANANMIRSFWGRRIKGKTQALRQFVANF